MNINLIERDVENRNRIIRNLENSLFYLKLEELKHKEAIYLVNYELFFMQDQLHNYNVLLKLLREENDEKVPETDL